MSRILAGWKKFSSLLFPWTGAILMERKFKENSGKRSHDKKMSHDSGFFRFQQQHADVYRWITGSQ